LWLWSILFFLQQIAQSLQSLLEYDGDDVEEAFGLTFQVTYSDVFGDLQACSLKEDGDNIPVTKDNLQVSLPELSFLYSSACLCDVVLL